MNKLISLNEFRTDKFYASTGKTYQVTKQKLIYLCEVCEIEHTVDIKTSNESRRGSIGYHLNNPCTSCVKRTDALNRLLIKAKTKFTNNEFDYSLINLANFQSGTTLVPVKCNKHSLIFNTSLYNHTAKYHSPNNPNNGGCPECAKEAQQDAETFTVSEWRTRLEDKFPHIGLNITALSTDKLLGSKEVSFMCSHHGSFDSTFHNMSKETYFCKLCAQDNNSWGGRARRTDIEGTLYLIHIPLLNVWKLGVTKHTVEERQRELSYEYEVVWTAEFTTLKAAYAEETRLFREYKDNRLKGVPKGLLGKAKGITELLNCSIPLTKVSHS